MEGSLLDPDLVYVDPEEFKTGFCVIPGRKEDFNSQLLLFIQYLMKHIDHKDRECVVLTYGLYQTCMKENYSLEDMMSILAEKMPEKRSDLVQEEETVRNFRITKGEETDRNFRDFRENSEDIREWKGKRKQRNRKSWKYQDRIRKAVSGDWLKSCFSCWYSWLQSGKRSRKGRK